MSARQSPSPRRRPSALDRFVVAGIFRLMGRPGWVDFVLTGGDVSRDTRYLMLTIIVTLTREGIERRGYRLYERWRRRYRPRLRVVRGKRLKADYRPRLPWAVFKKPPSEGAD